MKPQQQTVVTGAGPVQPVYVSQPAQTTSAVNSYRHRQSAAIGALLIIAGCLSIVFNIVDLAVGINFRYYTYYHGYYEQSLSYTSNGVICHGFWCSGLIIIAGGFGIGAARHKTRCMIITFMVLAIIGTVFAAIQLIVAGSGANDVRKEFKGFLTGYCDIISGDKCNDVRAVYAMEILLALLGVGEFALCLWGSILCCCAGGCCAVCARTPATVVTVPAGQPQVTVVSQQQPVAMAQPQTYPPQQVVYPPQYPQPQTYPPQPGYPGGHTPQ